MGMRWRGVLWWLLLLCQAATVHVLGARRTHTRTHTPPPAALTHHAKRARRRDSRCV